MYSPRQRDVRERRIRERGDEGHPADRAMAIDAEEGVDYETPSAWAVQLGTRASAA
jgi:hypothetical protein